MQIEFFERAEVFKKLVAMDVLIVLVLSGLEDLVFTNCELFMAL